MHLIIVLVTSFIFGSEQPGLIWTNGRDLAIEGQAWQDTKATWDRLPARAEGVVRDPVWGNSRHSAGMLLRFRSDSPRLHARWKLTSDQLSMPHMPATGVSGLDLYVHDGDGWRWTATPRPGSRLNEMELLADLDGRMRDWMLYLPLYNGIEAISIGTVEGSTIEPLPRPANDMPPIVFYGTSITHGACASRPGMCHVAILGRELDIEVVNLGFSGSGTMDPEMADFLGEIDASMYVVDCLPNLDGEQVAQRAVPFVKRLRALRPETPILLVEDRTWGDSHINASRAKYQTENRAALRAAWDDLKSEGVPNLHYLEGDRLLSEDGDGTVDGSHPTDLGFRHQADAFKEVIVPILNPKNGSL
ncbi:MAG: hypothetical protein CMJ40_10595 [Phycisphaerae bacterium]|nr:hypothetical protein [Phycisphaerae bacterium]